MTDSRVIKVAADGSPGSRRALRWALGEAERRGCTVELVTVFSAAIDPSEKPHVDEARSAAEALIQATLHDIKAPASVPISFHVVQGEPGDVLVRESASSDLLVMGSHGLGSIRHSALGSVTDTCARMAECPVVIVPVTHHDDSTDQVTVMAPSAISPTAGAERAQS
jgi:nucleotide-binding universal stress UspA family protein